MHNHFKILLNQPKIQWIEPLETKNNNILKQLKINLFNKQYLLLLFHFYDY